MTVSRPLDAIRPVLQTLADRYAAAGLWDGTTLPEAVAGAFSRHRHSRVRVHSALRPYSGSLGEVLDAGRAITAALQQEGIGTGDIVAFQLPNWSESLACFVGIALAGATLMPIAPYYREKEMRFILSRTQARVLVIAKEFRGRDHLGECEALRDVLPTLETVIVVGDGVLPAWATPFTRLAAGPPAPAPARVDPAGPAAIAWTSGTTSDPKGVVLAHRALMCEVRDHMAASLPSGPPRQSGAPLSHVTGMLATALVPPFRGEDIHLVDHWEPSAVLATMLAERIPPALYAPVFATSLLDHPSCTDEHLALMDTASLGGTTVPESLVTRLEQIGVRVTRGYGCTEHPSISLSRADDPLPWRNATDGRVLPGVEVRLVDDDDRDVPDGRPGEVLSRGPDMFSGYLDPLHDEGALDADGWFRTGDVAVRVEHDGGQWLRIVDRKKDIVIRSGVNISSAEVEAAVSTMAGVVEVAAVAVPDPRTGERVRVVVRPAPGVEIGLDDVRQHLTLSGMARQKWPEELVVIHHDLPRTPSGKVRKGDLAALLPES
jgi:acyl-CoA synthetase